MRVPREMQENVPVRPCQPGRCLDPVIAALCGMSGIVMAAIMLGMVHR